MSDVVGNQNLSSHYSQNAKVYRPGKQVATPPSSLPKPHLFNDTDANNRMKIINNEINIGYKKEKNSFGKKFVKVFATAVLALVAFIGIKRLFK